MRTLRLLTLCLVSLVSQPQISSSDKTLLAGLGQWQLLPSAGPPMHRHECAYVRVRNRFYLIGGRGTEPIKPVEIFDPATRHWSIGATPPVEMHHFQAVEYDGKIYVVGALTETRAFPKEPPLRHVYIYDPEKDRWSIGPSMPEDRLRGAAGTVVYQGKIYLVNGIQTGHWSGHVSWFDVFNPTSGEWHTLPDSPRPRDHFQAVVIGSKLYVIGGRRSSAAAKDQFSLTVPEVDVFDFQKQKWFTLPPSANLPTLRAGCASLAVKGHILVLGGESGTQRAAHSEVELFDPQRGSWSSLAPLQTGRHATQAILYQHRVYIAAGSATRGATEINSQEVLTVPPRWR